MSKFKDFCCIICNTNITDSSTISIRNYMRPLSNPELSLYTFFQLISNFNQLDISKVPQNACDKCYQDALHVLDFQTLCNKAVENIKTYSKDIEHVYVGNDCGDDLSINGPLSLYLSEENTQDGYNVEVDDFNVEIITENSDNDKDEDIEQLPAPVPAIRNRKQAKQAEKVECGQCHKLYRRDYMRIHNRLHNGERPFKCKLCPKDFNNGTSLQLHMRMHYDERPYLCTVCGAAFRKKTVLNGHTLTHTGVRPYVCEICGKTFRGKGTRDAHYTTHSAAKPFACSECPKRFSLKKLLKQHMVTHAKIKPIECTFCGKRFTQKHVLRTHLAKSCQGPGNDEASLV